MSAVIEIPPTLRDDLLTYLFCTSPDRARIIAELVQRNPGIADLLMDLEADEATCPDTRSPSSRGRGPPPHECTDD